MGITWREAGEHDLPSLEALEREWKLRPPVNRLVAAYLEYEPPSDVLPAATREEMHEELQRDLTARRDLPPIDTTAFDAAIAAIAAAVPHEKE